MTEAVILYRGQNGAIGTITDDDNVAIFATRDEAISFALASPFLSAVPYQIVEVDEL